MEGAGLRPVLDWACPVASPGNSPVVLPAAAAHGLHWLLQAVVPGAYWGGGGA